LCGICDTKRDECGLKEKAALNHIRWADVAQL
jgi:hypothetical protein